MAIKDFRDNQDADNSSGSSSGMPPNLAVLFGMPGGPNQGRDTTQQPSTLIDLNAKHAEDQPALFRDRSIEQTMSVLIGKNKPNPLLVGSAGVGKTRIVEDIARRIANDDALVPAQLRGFTVYELAVSDLVSGSSFVGQLEAKVKEVIDFASDPQNRAIVFIDEIHLVVDDRDPSYSKISQILKPALARGQLRVIGATTSQESRDLDNDPAFNRRFTKLVVDELTREQTLTVLESVRPQLIEHYNGEVSVDDRVLARTVTIADQGSRAGSHRPDSAITLLDRAMADRILEQKRLISEAQAAGQAGVVNALNAISTVRLTETRVNDVAKRLLTGHAVKHDFVVDDLHTQLTDSIQGQDLALSQVTDRLAREELALFPRTTPITWMFAGASGVGKTETTKLIAQAVTDQDPIILNMTEYNSAEAVNRIIGSAAGYVGYDTNAELPFDDLESNPHRVILLDEFEKADRAVQRLFLSAFDEGSIKTSRGKIIDFSKAIVIATTNAAREELQGRTIGFGDDRPTFTQRSLSSALAQHFDAELLGRFTLLVGFQPITEGVYRDVLAGRYRTERAAIAADQPRLAAALADELSTEQIDEMVTATFDLNLGARPAIKAVRALIEDQIFDYKARSGLIDDTDNGQGRNGPTVTVVDDDPVDRRRTNPSPNVTR